MTWMPAGYPVTRSIAVVPSPRHRELESGSDQATTLIKMPRSFTAALVVR